MERALRSRGLDPPPPGAAVEAARWLPRLTLGAIVDRALGPTAHDQTTVIGTLAWPLDERSSGLALEQERLRRKTASQRQRLLDRIAEVWQRRLQAQTLADDVESELSIEEADAELDVLTGRGDEDGP
jgi:hypothetical protein